MNILQKTCFVVILLLKQQNSYQKVIKLLEKRFQNDVDFWIKVEENLQVCEKNSVERRVRLKI